MKKLDETSKEKIITGYPHIDMPWMQYYDANYYTCNLPKMTILDYIKNSNSSNLDGLALSYFGKEISYGELFEYINNASKGLSSIGVDDKSRVLYLMPNIPETAYLLYGGSQLGAISDYVDPRPDSIDSVVSARKLLKTIENEKIDQIICLDQCYLSMIKPIEHELIDLGIDKLIMASPSDSMNQTAKSNYLLEQIKFEGLNSTLKKLKRTKAITEMIAEERLKSPLEIVDYSNLISNSRFTIPHYIQHDDNRIATIVHTSGTSSPEPKPIPLTHDNLNAYSEQIKKANMPMEKGDRALQILPYFAAFGLCGVVHGGFSNGCNLIQIPEFSPINFGKLILKYKPQIIIGTPSWLLSLLRDPILSNANLSFLKMVTYGGDSMESEDEMLVNDFLLKHGCKCKITKGHGMSEACGCSSYAIDEYNVPGSIGIPMPNTIYAVVKPGTTELIRFTDDKDYIEGEFVISSKCITPGVLDDNVIIEHIIIDGIDFIKTKDLGIMYKNGVMKFLSRTDRTFSRFDGFKYRTYEIENVIKQYPGVKYCILSPYYDDRKSGNMPLADIVLDDDIDFDEFDKVEFTKKMIEDRFINNPNVSTRQIPSIVRYRKELPLTKNSKVDYVELKNEEIVNAVCVDVDETNIQVSGIEYYEYSSNLQLKIKK